MRRVVLVALPGVDIEELEAKVQAQCDCCAKCCETSSLRLPGCTGGPAGRGHPEDRGGGAGAVRRAAAQRGGAAGALALLHRHGRQQGALHEPAALLLLH